MSSYGRTCERTKGPLVPKLIGDPQNSTAASENFIEFGHRTFAFAGYDGTQQGGRLNSSLPLNLGIQFCAGNRIGSRSRE